MFSLWLSVLRYLGSTMIAQEHAQLYRYDLEGIKFVVESFEIRQVMTIIPK